MATYNRLLIVEDQTILRDLFSNMLSLDSFFSYVTTASNVEMALDMVSREFHYDLIITDLMLGDGSGLELLKSIRSTELPHSNTKVIIITAFNKPACLKTAIALNANGFLLKDTSLREFKKNIESVMQGDTVISDGILQSSFEALSIFSEKELSILNKILEGKSNKIIANETFLSEGTVKNYISAIMRKTKTSNRLHAANEAKNHGWI